MPSDDETRQQGLFGAEAAGRGTRARRAGCIGAGVEWILGFRVRGRALRIDPCIPPAWRGFELRFRYHSARYEIAVENPRAATRSVTSIELDGKTVVAGGEPEIPLADDGMIHRVRVVIG